MKKGYPRGGWNKLPIDELQEKQRRIVELRMQGLKVATIAEKLNTTYGSVTYTLYRKEDNGLLK